MRWGRCALVNSVVLGLLLHVQNIAYAQRSPAWILRSEVGKAEIHDSPDDGPWGAFRIGRQLEAKGYARFDLGLSFSYVGEGFAALEIGLEVRPLAAAIVTPVLGGGVGFLAEPEFGGAVVRVMGAVDVKIERKMGLRLGLQLGQHGSRDGPDVIFAGLEFALGKSGA